MRSRSEATTFPKSQLNLQGGHLCPIFFAKMGKNCKQTADKNVNFLALPTYGQRGYFLSYDHFEIVNFNLGHPVQHCYSPLQGQFL